MKVCYLQPRCPQPPDPQPPDPQPCQSLAPPPPGRAAPVPSEPIGLAWARALGASTLELAALAREVSTANARRQPISFDIVLVDLTREALPVVAAAAGLLISQPSCKLVLHVAEPLPAAPAELEPWKTAIELADLVITPSHRACLELRAQTTAAVCPLAPPGRDDVAAWATTSCLRSVPSSPRPRCAGEGHGEPGQMGTFAFGTSSALGETRRGSSDRQRVSPTSADLRGPLARGERGRNLTLVSTEPHSRFRLLREIGLVAYVSTLLGGRVRWLHPAAPAAERDAVLRQSAFVYLPTAIEDGGELALACARSGAILIAHLDYDAARAPFPYTTFDETQRGRRGLLLLWLHTSREFQEFFRESARHGARWLADENRRVQLARRLEYQFPEQGYALPASGAPALLDQIRHRHGPIDVPPESTECLLVCLVRNGEEHIPAFLVHYRALGVRHFFFIDNGSDDATLALLEAQPDVTTYATALPHKHYEREIRRLIIERHCRGSWCLNVDIDELFDYPFSNELGLVGLLAYLSQQKATAMAGYLLDMYARENSFGDTGPLDLRSAYPYYDIEDVQRADYYTHQIKAFCDRNTLADPNVQCYFGGIRKTLFGSRSGEDYLLTKHPLIFLDGELEPVTHPHYSNGARVADVTCVLYHYKFTPSFKAKVEESRVSKRYVKFAQGQYEQYQKRIGERASLVIDTPGTQRLGDVAELVEQGFLRASPAYQAHVRSVVLREKEKRGPGGQTERRSSAGLAPMRQRPTAVTVCAVLALLSMVALAVGGRLSGTRGLVSVAAWSPAATLIELGDAAFALFGLLALVALGSAAVYLLEGLWRRRRLVGLAGAMLLIAAALTPLGASLVAFACGLVVVANAFIYVYLASKTLLRGARPRASQRALPHALPNPLPSVCVIVPARDEASVIEETLRALDAVDYPKSRLEIVVIDDGSTDATGARVSACREWMSHRVRSIVFERSEGKARRINQLLPTLSAEFVLLLDADHAIPRDGVRRLLAPFSAAGDIAGVQAASAVRNGHESLLARALEMEYLFRCQGTYPGKPMGIFVGSGGMFRRSDLLAVGGFDPSMLTEDVELSYRLYANGKRIVYDPSVCTHDLAMTDFGNFFNQRYRWMRGLWQAMLHHLPKAEPRGPLRRVSAYFIQCTSDGLVALCLSVLFMYVFLEQLGVVGVQPRLPPYLMLLACSYAFGVGFVRARRYGLFACLPLVPLYSVLHAIPMAWALIDGYVLGKPSVWVKTDRSLIRPAPIA
jgi:glycosyltransferase involved in cell wall biosynthesis